MNITVKYFGMVADTTAKSSETLSTEIDNLNDLRQLLISLYPNLKNITFQIAVNQSFLGENVKIKNNDELALLPPFAGG